MNDKLKQLQREIENIKGIEDQLEYYKNEYFLRYNQNVEKLADILDCNTFVTALKLPKEIYTVHFSDYSLPVNTREQLNYYNWWLDFNAVYDRRFFPKYKEKIDQFNLLENQQELFRKELKKIEAFEKEVNEMHEQDNISFDSTIKEPYKEHKIYLKLKYGYYKRNALDELRFHFDEICDIKAKYLVKGSYLRELIQEEENPIPKFKNFLYSNKAEEITRALTSNYNNKKPQELTLMLFALIDMEYLSQDILSNRTRLYKILSAEFCFQGSRQGLNNSISNMFRPDDSEKAAIQAHVDKIQKLLSK